MLRFIVIFVVVLAVLFRIDMLDEVQRVAIEPWAELLAIASATLMMPFDPDVTQYGRIIMSKATGFAVSIEAGCNGVEAAIILVAGMIAFPSSLKHKLVGIVAGIAAVQGVNLLRIISLYYLGKWNMSVFEFAHLYLWQALIMLDVLVVWMLWIRWIAQRNAPVPVAAAHAV